ncbi:MAG: tyrosine-type recombinase/integrase [Dehalococcoidia bacterium]|nr:MAG: tyrosine-type recombinase/integrase [Dehalococcoidia bacterium]
MKPDTITRSFLRIGRRIGLHDLRHTHATLMLKQNIHPKIVQDRLGHATISITLDTYSHVLPGLQEAAALKFDEGFNVALSEAEHVRSNTV